MSMRSHELNKNHRRRLVGSRGGVFMLQVYEVLKDSVREERNDDAEVKMY